MKKFKIEPDLTFSGSMQYTLYALESRSTSIWAWRPWSPRWEVRYKGTIMECKAYADHLSQPTEYL